MTPLVFGKPYFITNGSPTIRGLDKNERHVCASSFLSGGFNATLIASLFCGFYHDPWPHPCGFVPILSLAGRPTQAEKTPAAPPPGPRQFRGAGRRIKNLKISGFWNKV
jgi:hypothetical protein